ncbi:MAG TPA: hypothetical protein VGD74_06405 [Vulgatibacter sp.]
MPLFLAGLLVRGGALAPEAAEEALQRQSLLGGSIDTSLLELGHIDEEALLPYLARASGLSAIPAGTLDGPLDPSLRDAVSLKAAERYGVVPFGFDGESLLVACAHPAEATPLHEVAPGIPRVVAFVAPEVRIRQAIGRLHGSAVAPRFDELASRLRARLGGGAAADPGHGAGSPSREEAFTLLGSAADRDDALAVLLRFAHQHFELAAALRISGKNLVGWDALAPEPGAAARIKKLALPLAKASVLRLVVETGAPYLGPLGEQDCALELEAALGRRAPQVVLVVPIAVANRTVALLFAENGDHPIAPNHVEPVMNVAQAVGPALEKLIRARKQAGRPAASSPVAIAAPVASAVPVASKPIAAAEAPITAAVPAVGEAASDVPAHVPRRAAVNQAFKIGPSLAAQRTNSNADGGATTLAPNVPSDVAGTAPVALHLPKVAHRSSESPAQSPIEPVRLAVERALAARTTEETESALPALREIPAIAAQMLVALLPASAPPEGDESLRVVRVLKLLGASAMPALARAAASPSRGVRLQAVRLAAAMKSGEALALLAALASDDDPEVAAEAGRAIEAT